MIAGDALVIGRGGETASILAIGDVLATDTVYAEKGGKRINGVWNSARQGFILSPIREYGTWTLTAKRNGKSDIIKSVLIDAAEEFTVNMILRLYLYNQGEECVDVTGGWNNTIKSSAASSSAVLQKYEAYMQSNQTNVNQWLGRTTSGLVDLSDYHSLLLVRNVITSNQLMDEIAIYSAVPTSWDQNLVANQGANAENVGKSIIVLDVTQYQGLYCVGIKNSWGGVQFDQVWLE